MHLLRALQCAQEQRLIHPPGFSFRVSKGRGRNGYERAPVFTPGYPESAAQPFVVVVGKPNRERSVTRDVKGAMVLSRSV
jgi:hypothetical protein